MKVTTRDFMVMNEAIAPLDTTEERARYRSGNFPRAEAVRDLDKRYRNDLFYRSGTLSRLAGEYLDSHLDTALRNIVAPLDTPDGPDSLRHRLHTVTVGHDGVNRCSCGDTWSNQTGQTPLDKLLRGDGDG